MEDKPSESPETPASGSDDPLLEPMAHGEKLGRYTLLNELATGGMATLYLARVTGPSGFEKYFAVKRIHPHLAKEKHFVEMFLDEARIAARISHPNVVQIHELGVVEKNLFITMEYIEGESLARLMSTVWKKPQSGGHRTRFPLREAVHIIGETAAGLHAAHELCAPDGQHIDLVHRDVSPHNILVSYGGHVKLIDFGVAKARWRIAHTDGGAVKGKIAYMSPEQLQGEPLDRRSDLFSLGIVLYELTTGRRLFKQSADVGSLAQIINVTIRRPTEVLADYPRELEDVVLRALAKKREDRFQTADEMRRALEHVAMSLGPPRGATDLGVIMRTVFADRMQQKSRLRDGYHMADLEAEQSDRISSSGTLDLGPATPSVDSLKPTVVQQLGGKRRPGVLIAGLGGIIAVLVLILVWALGMRSAAPPPSRLGSVRISSSPAGAAVYANGQGPVANTPALLGELVPGALTLALQLDGYQRWERTLQVGDKGQEIILDASLLPLPKPTVQEPPAATQPAPQPLPQEPAVAQPETTAPRVRAPAPRPPAARKPGQLTLDAAPWAEVWLGSKKLGQTPLIDLSLPAGTHTLMLLPKGQKPGRRLQIEIKPGQKTRKQVTLDNLR
ncbi:MAG: serine/threonine-protein kinase [Pseudomonadota bacterium]